MYFFFKNSSDKWMALLLVMLTIPFWVIAWVVSIMATRSSGLFFQKRIGKNGTIFTIIKFRTISPHQNTLPIKSFLRNYKIDEWPQLINIIKGDMSFVGPRPDLPSVYTIQDTEHATVLSVKPGLTSPASLFFFDEEKLVQNQADDYYETIVFPQKIKMNLEYVHHISFRTDLLLLLKTGVLFLQKINPFSK